jgi:diguanylate cyclase (GGDEF)-like protein
LDYTGEKVLMVTAIPFDTEDGRVVLELLRDVTTTGIIDDGAESMEIAKLISLRNDKMVKDTLVNCYNKRYITERLPYEIVDAAINNSRLAVIMADIDWFRVVNNTYGHQAGDDCLKAIGSLLSQKVRRASDLAARYGGEEFVVILQEPEQEKLLDFAQDIRRSAQGLGIEHRQSPYEKVTVSIGVACMIPTVEAEPAALVEAADRALYQAKQKGRNRVEMSGDA